MLIFGLLLLVVLFWMSHRVIKVFRLEKARRPVMYAIYLLFAIVLGLILFKILKGLFFVAIPMVILLIYMIVVKPKK